MNYQKISLIIVCLLLLMAACAVAQPVDPLAKVKAYEVAHNAYDVESAMALFAGDAEFELVGQGTFSSLDAIRGVEGLG